MNALAKNIGHRIKVLRETRGLTQAQLAQLTLKSVETISNFERGKVLPGLLAIEATAKALDCKMSDFFDEIPVKSNARERSTAAQKVLNSVDLLPEEDVQIVASFIETLQKRTTSQTK